MYCAICKKQVDFYEKEYNMINDGSYALISPGYGSKFDLTDIKVVICDSCIEEIVNDEDKIVEIKHLHS